METSRRAVPPPLAQPLPIPAPLPVPGPAQLVVAVLLLAAALALSGYLLWNGEPARAANDVETRVQARPIPALAESRATAVTLARGWLRAPLTLHAGSHRFSLARGALGVRVDVAGLTALLDAARDPISPLRRLHATRRGDVPLDLPIPARLEGEAARGWLHELADELAEPSRGARVDFAHATLVPPRAGRTLDIEATLDQLADAVFTGASDANAAFAPRPVPPEAGVNGPLDFTTVLGSAESMVRDDDPTHTHNLRLAAQRLDGVLLVPNGSFDARAELEELARLGRFHPGKMVAGAVDPVEAAVAQVLRTLHAAFIDAEIALLEEPWLSDDPHAHVNLRLASPLAHACALALEVKDGHLRAAIRGAASDALPATAR